MGGRLVGVDMSAKMLGKARAAGYYDAVSEGRRRMETRWPIHIEAKLTSTATRGTPVAPSTEETRKHFRKLLGRFGLI